MPATRRLTLPRWTLLARRAGWLAYAVLLILATHWPGVHIEGPVPRTDLWLHLGALGAWTVGLASTAWPGPVLTSAALLRTALISAPYAALSELSQGLPGIHRVVAWEDAVANLGGVALGLLALGAASALGRSVGIGVVEADREPTA